ncbi:hypothetical protein [Aureimonas sp. N4]|uniref:hypothetical protein n=1 Tax=Aureimonas sp. N4 TaxID=1638165 RepID=UPI000783B218|nr:hypothetical protein [Aureimonas sp. N4]
MMARKGSPSLQALTRARRRELGMRSMEAVLYESELETLDVIKTRLNLTSRSEVLRMMIAKTDPDSFTPADAAVIREDAA